jgi:hypothetical protein
MNEVPSVGGTRGIFEIFVPGAFLLLNITWVAYVWPTTAGDIRQFITTIASQAVPGLAVLVCFGYLLGIVLRLLKTRVPDRWSGYFGWLLTEIMGQNGKPYLEEFPYFTHIEKVAKHKLPEDAHHFYCQFWGKRAAGDNREFFNYCKTIINAVDQRSAAEVYVAEALTRYVASMFYALLASFILALAAAAATSSRAWLVLACAYFVAIIVILRHLRFLRVKEVETVFAATLRNYYSRKWPEITEKDLRTTA